MISNHTEKAPLRNILRADTSWGDLRDMIVCPVCGYDFIHVGEIKPLDAERDTGVVINLWGECGHSFDLTLITHKGNTFTYVDNAIEERSVPMTHIEPLATVESKPYASQHLITGKSE